MSKRINQADRPLRDVDPNVIHGVEWFQTMLDMTAAQAADVVADMSSERAQQVISGLVRVNTISDLLLKGLMYKHRDAFDAALAELGVEAMVIEMPNDHEED